MVETLTWAPASMSTRTTSARPRAEAWWSAVRRDCARAGEGQKIKSYRSGAGGGAGKEKGVGEGRASHLAAVVDIGAGLDLVLHLEHVAPAGRLPQPPG